MRVLIISKFFPPMKNARARQMTKIVNALVEAGCEVQVVGGLEDDETEMPSWHFPVQYVPFQKYQAKSAYPGVLGRWSNRFCCAKLWYRWAHKAFDVCRELVDKFRPDVVLSASYPYDSHYVGLLLRRSTKIRWVAFFSDPCPSSIMPAPYRRSFGFAKDLWEIRLVRQVLQSCDALVMTNFYALRLMERAINVRILHKSFSIPHVGSNSSKKTAHIDRHLAHIGDLHNRLCLPLLEAVKQVASEMPDKFQGLLFVGNITDEFRRLVSEKNMENLVEFRGYVPAPEAEEIAATSHSLLVIEANMTESPFLPSKFADYAMIGRSIIAITPPVSPIRDYLTEYGGGLAVDHNIQEIARAIRYIFSRVHLRHDKGNDKRGVLSLNFTASRVAASYLELFDRITPRGQ